MISLNFAFEEKYRSHTVTLNIEETATPDTYSHAIEKLIHDFIPYIGKTQNDMYSLEIIVAGEEISEPTFWEKAILDFRLEDLAIRYHKALIHLVKSSKPVWLDEENPAGRSAAFYLSKLSVANLPYYTEYIKWHDMDHEVSEYQDIEELIKMYGWCPETLELAAVRGGIGCGQEGLWQFDSFVKEMGLREYLLENNLLDHFVFAVFLENYLKHYGEIMKNNRHFHWPLSYCLDFVSDILADLIEDEDVAGEYFAKCRSIAENYYAEHKLPV